MISFVVVLPLDPVTPIRVTDGRLRMRSAGEILEGGKGIRQPTRCPAHEPRPGRQARPLRRSAWASETSSAAAPLSAAWRRNSCPSVRSPGQRHE